MSVLSIQSSSAAVIASDDDGGGQRYIRSSSNVGLLSIQSSSVAAVIASDDDGGGQRYIRSSSNVGLLSIQVVVLPPSLVPPDSARSPALRPDRKSRRWLLLLFKNGVSCACMPLHSYPGKRASTTVDFGPVFSGRCNRRDFRYRYLRGDMSAFVATGPGVSKVDFRC
jgi:hypothetical protein